MNIFYLDESPKKSAEAMTDKHVVKMIVESAQLMSTAHRLLDGEMFIQLSASGAKLKKWNHPQYHDVLYKSTHRNHPSAVWVRESIENYRWLYEHFVTLCSEYTKRYNKTHLTWKKLGEILKTPPINIPSVPMTAVKLAHPPQYDADTAVQSYRNYYEAEKLHTDKDWKRYKEILKL